MYCFCNTKMKLIRKDKQCTDDGTCVILHLKCPVCGSEWDSDLLEDEKDYE